MTYTEFLGNVILTVLTLGMCAGFLACVLGMFGFWD